MNKAEELITCLEREIAKRDARIAELEGALSWHEEQRNDMAELRAELAAIKAQEPAAFAFRYDDGSWHDVSATQHSAGMVSLYAAPVSEAKAQGVVMPEREVITNTIGFEFLPGELQTVNSDDLVALVHAARLNVAPVQQVSVPDVSAMARILADRNADACNVNREDNWAIYGQDYIDDVTAMLAAAPAAPGAKP